MQSIHGRKTLYHTFSLLINERLIVASSNVSLLLLSRPQPGSLKWIVTVSLSLVLYKSRIYLFSPLIKIEANKRKKNKNTVDETSNVAANTAADSMLISSENMFIQVHTHWTIICQVKYDDIDWTCFAPTD